MLPTVLVILAASGTLAAPVEDVDLNAVNLISVLQDSENLVSAVSRLNNANSVRSNNVAVALTAALLQPVNDIFQIASGTIGDLVKDLSVANASAATTAVRDALAGATDELLN